MEELKEEAKHSNTESKQKKSKKAIIPIIILIVIALLVGALIWWVNYNKKQEHEQLQEIYDCLTKSTDLLDIVADDIYSCWYNAIYKSRTDISVAVATSEINTQEEREQVEIYTNELYDLVTELKNNNYNEKHQDTYNTIMDAYDKYKEYYEFTINVSGSFKTYSNDKETLKKEVRSCISKLERNL